LQFFHEIKRKLDTETRGLNIEISHQAYQTAKYIQRQYEKDVSNLEKLHVTFRHEQKNKDLTATRLTEHIEEVDELKGELNILSDKKTRNKQNIVEIE